MKLEDLKISWWLSAALDDPTTCKEFKDDINTFFILSKDYTIINNKDLAELEDRDNKLSYLEAGGVDNWGGYPEALSDYWGDEKNEE